MFGKNSVWTPKSFDNEPEGTLLVTSVFPTLQGEGPFAGRPAVFLRLAYCNLRCSFCDTWFDHGDRMTFDEIDEKIEEAQKAFSFGKPPMLIVTGGEPLMQSNLEPFLFRRIFLEWVQIETNGNFYQEFRSQPYIVVSPKVNEATGAYIKVHPRTLRSALALKFVVSSDKLGYTDIPDWALQWRDQAGGYYTTSKNIYLSPMNMYAKQPELPKPGEDLAERTKKERISFWEPGLLDMEANQRNHEHAAKLAMKYGCILSLQQHLYCSMP